jgi:hypothetical protein
MLALATGCNRNKDATADPSAAEAQAGLVEERDDGKLEWIITPEGQVRVVVTPNEGAAPSLAGALMLEGQSYALAAKGTALEASIPKLTDDLTTIAYSIKVGDATWDGSLQVPPGGTKDLLEVPAVTLPEDAKGPHGGVLDVVGDQRIELVTDEATGEVRVYFLDENLQPIPVGDAKAVAAFAQ